MGRFDIFKRKFIKNLANQHTIVFFRLDFIKSVVLQRSQYLYAGSCESHQISSLLAASGRGLHSIGL